MSHKFDVRSPGVSFTVECGHEAMARNVKKFLEDNLKDVTLGTIYRWHEVGTPILNDEMIFMLDGKRLGEKEE